MKQLKSLFAAPGNAVRNGCIAVTGAVLSAPTFAAIDLPQIKTDIEANQATGEEVGGYVIASVCAFVVVAIIIGMVKKA
ncbi:major capsid protein [Pseudomonas sp. 32.2.56]|uniref:major capsid protein n=1 Tax=Pseudomonas sp. 32.2.56 TaxID=2969303 RepID=UPI00214FA702|nr:major capsid protein [Pseudomonas sp. 32.2.56]MCR4510169.1 major capsid protein [Pseudomonas sp. 32.2.56]